MTTLIDRLLSKIYRAKRECRRYGTESARRKRARADEEATR